MLEGTQAQRTEHIEALARRLGPEILVVDDLRDGWPALCRLRVGDEWVRIALHVGTIGSSLRGRDDRERRFQNPSQNKPMSDPPGYRPVLIGLAYDQRGEVIAVAGMDAERRLGRPTRFSMFIPADGLTHASQSGWYEHRSGSGELIRIAHPALLPVIVALEGVPTPVTGIGTAIASVGIRLSRSGSEEESIARREALRVARRAVFEGEVRAAYDGQCALCEPSQDATHVLVLAGGQSAGVPELDEALPMCGHHYRAFRQHQLYVDPASRAVRIGPNALTAVPDEVGKRAIIQRTRRKLGAPSDGHHAVGAEQLIRHYRQHEQEYAWAKQDQEVDEPLPLVTKSDPASQGTGAEKATTGPRAKESAGSEERAVSDQVANRPAGADRALRSDEAMSSIEALADLLLTSTEAKRSLILRNRIMAADENSPSKALVDALLRRYGHDLTVRKLLDSQSEAMVVDLLCGMDWRGENQAYRFAKPDADPASMRQAVLRLTMLVLAQLKSGKAGVDSIATSNEFLQPIPFEEEQPSSLPKEEPEPEAEDSISHLAIIKAVAMSNTGDVLVAIDDDLMSLPSKAVRLMDAQWRGWSSIAQDPDFDIRAAVALTGLSKDEVDAVVAHLHTGGHLRYVELDDPPSLGEVAVYLSSLPTEIGLAASERLRAMFFADQFHTQEEFLLGCLAEMKGCRTNG